MTERVKRLLETMCLSEHEGVLVYNPSNMFYLSGYTGEGLVLASQKHCAIVTDFRYTEQAETQAPGFEVLMTGNNKSHEEIVGELCAAQGIDTLYYEDDYITVRTMEKCRASIHGVEWKTVGAAVELLREQKDEHELALIAEACRITGDAFERILPSIKEGMTEKELALMLDFDMMTHGASKPSFSTIVAAGANGSLPHAVPGDYKLRRGDMITMDFGARYGNYCADMTRTVALGQPSDEMKKVYGIVLDAQKMAQDAVAAGKVCRDIDSIARDYIYSHGYEGRFGHGLGHSVGIDIHENPRFSQPCTAVLKPGQVMTVEPGIYLPGVGGVRIENSVVVREGGCEVLTKPTRELIIL
ncbi:MAG: aminopeptidase P family protein [Clostridiales bacterium]|nr:aminopeptidase P family protein [Clostridiales bacterium]